MYDPRDMLLFAKVAELGSMSAAARRAVLCQKLNG